MAVTYVDGDTSSASTSVTSVSLTVPTVQSGDFGMIVFGHSSGTITTPTGWTVSNNLTISGTLFGIIFTRYMDAADSGDTITINNTGSQRMSATLAVYRGTTGIGVTGTRVESTATVTHPNPTVTSPTGGSSTITAILERSSTPSTSFSQPSGYALRENSYGTGSGAVSSAFADDLTNVTAGGSLGGDDWTASAANQGVGTWTFGLVPSTSTALSGSLVLVPTSGTAPLAVTATATFTGGTGTTKNYTFHWGDGATTGPQTSNTASHTYTAPGNYTTAAGNPVYVDCTNS